MTREEIIEKAKKICFSSNPQDYIQFVGELAELEPEQLPDNLDDVAEEYADKHGFRVPYDGSNNFYDGVDVKASLEGFKAGAKWMAEQGVNLEATIENHPELVRNSGDHHLLVVEKIDETTNKLPEGKYIIQIRKAK